ncbi:MAG TPA: PfkB family carbohydrate kinase [Pyrinomonadaceae bacterium]|nr:PfkB family carbohydrate kinase [Pyrinomonadaceae bacterium]
MNNERCTRAEQLAALLESFPRRKVLVVGDMVADQFLYGEISRVSREAPVLILRHERTETIPGGAANAAANLASLGARAVIVGVAGEDESGRALMEKLRCCGVECGGVVTLPRGRTTTKMRVLAGQVHSTKQQVIRVDYDGESSFDTEVRQQLLARIHEEIQDADAVIISDYNYGVVDTAVAAAAWYSADQRSIPILVDSRFRLSDFHKFNSATPNEDEVEQLHGRPIKSDEELETAGERLRSRLDYRALLVTRGSRGMVLFEEGRAPLHIEAVGSREPVDVTGAGDTVIAAYSLAIASGASFADAAHLANFAGGLVVMKRGTATTTRDEMLASIKRV